METKLTLKLDKDVIEQAKIYSQKKNISLSRMVEKYFKSLFYEKTKDNFTPLVKELTGIINLNEKSNYKDDYADYLTEKYN